MCGGVVIVVGVWRGSDSSGCVGVWRVSDE